MKKYKLLLMLPLLFLLIGCMDRVDVGATQTDSQSVELGDAESAVVAIQMGVGKLNVSGGATNLMDAEFTYNIETWRPIVDYQQRGRIGELQISQPASEINGIPNSNIKYSWEIALNDDVPLEMDIDLGVGESDLILGGLTLQSLLIDTGVGKATIDLTGDWQQSFDVTINGGVGETIIYLPEGVGLRVAASTGIGSLVINGLEKDGDLYTNAAYGDSEVSITLDIEGGIGQITVQVGR